MYDYISLRIDAEPCDENITDLLASFLADAEFETFEPDDRGMTAYVRKDKYDEKEVSLILSQFPIPAKFTSSVTEIEGQDWNKEWEENYFKPILIDNRLLIRSSFHSDYPPASIEILIDPKMAFGTGHHATTAGMSRMLMEEDLRGLTVIDMGTGTGILSILAKKLGAGDTVGIDIDEFAIENAKENGESNGENILWIAGDENILKNLPSADIFLANINLNVILENLSSYVKNLKPGGKIFLSGFLDTDRDTIIAPAEKEGLSLIKETTEKGWQTMVFVNLLGV